MYISHKIEIRPNNSCRTIFQKSIRCSRVVFNWALARFLERRAHGICMTSCSLLREFEQIRKQQFPEISEVGVHIYRQAFRTLDRAIASKNPQFKRWKLGDGSFFVSGDRIALTDRPAISDHLDIHSDRKRYLRLPKVGYVKMTEELRFQGRILGVTISRSGERYYAAFSVEITEAEFRRTHGRDMNRRSGVGLDAGLDSFAYLSAGLAIKAPKPRKEYRTIVARASRRLERKHHPDGHSSDTAKSNNYIKETMKLRRLHRKISNIRNDFVQKLSTAIVRYHGYIALENLDVAGMMKTHTLAGSVSDAAFASFRTMLDYKAGWYGKRIVMADRFYPSSQLCSRCGSRHPMPLSRRVFICPVCGLSLDRDYNASLNLYAMIEKRIGKVLPEYTPADLAELQHCLERNRIVHVEVEAGIQQRAEPHRSVGPALPLC
ncbi:MAG: transposase [Spirochaetales bacterium]|nr:transposase [Spirochaetales bacterium]